MAAYAGPTTPYVGDKQLDLLRKAALSASNLLNDSGGETGPISPTENGEYTGTTVPDLGDTEYELVLKLAASLHRLNAL